MDAYEMFIYKHVMGTYETDALWLCNISMQLMYMKHPIRKTIK